MPLWPFLLYSGAVIALVVAMVGVSYLLGEHHAEPATGQPYEGGVLTTGSARVRLTAPFYLVAVFFLIFDLEAVFLFAWAVAARALGWAGYAEVALFVAVLVAALVYLWRDGALDWRPAALRGDVASREGRK